VHKNQIFGLSNLSPGMYECRLIDKMKIIESLHLYKKQTSIKGRATENGLRNKLHLFTHVYMTVLLAAILYCTTYTERHFRVQLCFHLPETENTFNINKGTQEFQNLITLDVTRISSKTIQNIKYINTNRQNRDISAGIALGYGLDSRSSRFRFSAGAGNFSLHHRVQNGSGAHPASYPLSTR
jgi:hypothetical protein